MPVAVTAGYAKLLRDAKLEHEIGNSLVVREAVGVVGAITPWNYPLHQIMAKVAPGAGRGMHGGLEAERDRAAECDAAGRGCHRDRTARGRAQHRHRVTDRWSAKRSPRIRWSIWSASPARVRAGKRVAALAADTIKKVTLELGGKSAFVILDDAPFEKAVPAGARNSMLNSGQTCSAWTRMLVPRARQQDAIDLATESGRRS